MYELPLDPPNALLSIVGGVIGAVLVLSQLPRVRRWREARRQRRAIARARARLDDLRGWSDR